MKCPLCDKDGYEDKIPNIFDAWWLRVKETYCDKCKKMTPTSQYCGHFSCCVCGELTGFWMSPVQFTSLGLGGINQLPVKDIEGVKRWNIEGTKLVPVKYTLLTGEDLK